MSGTEDAVVKVEGAAIAPKVEIISGAEEVGIADDATLPEQARQDEAMSVQTVPDETVKQEAGDAGDAGDVAVGANGLQVPYLGGVPHAPAVPRGEIIMTPAEAKQQKLQKGYSLVPVLVDPAAVAPPALVSGKRERKTSKMFGHSPDNDDDATARPKAGRPPGRPRLDGVCATPKSSRSGGGVSNGQHTFLLDTTPSSAPWITDKKKILQERLAKIIKQLKKFSGPPAASRGGYSVAQSPAPPSPGLWHHGAAETPAPMYGYGQAPASRSMSVDGGDYFTPGTGSLNGRGGRDRKRPREGSELPAVGLLAGSKKPKIKKGQDRLAATGKLRNLYLHSEKLIEGLMKEKMALAYFNVPVDPDALGIPQYRELVTNPMDLGTIKSKLEGGFYNGIEMLEEDVYLVFDNAMFFNPPGTDVHECAKALKDISEKRIKRLPKAPTPSSRSGSSGMTHTSDYPGTGTPNSTGGGGTAADQRKMADMMRKMEQMQRDLELVKSKGSAAKKPADTSAKRKSGGGGGANRIMTFEDKRTLSLNINKLPHEKLGKVVEIIKKRRSNVVGNSEEIEIDIDLLDNATLKDLDKYVKDCLNPKLKTPAASKTAALQSAVQEVVGSVGVGAAGGIKGGSDSESESSDSDAD